MQKSNSTILWTVALAAALSFPALANRDQEVQAALNEFHQNPQAFMNKKVKKFKPTHPTQSVKFSEKHKDNVQHHKHAWRARHHKVKPHGKESPAANDNARNLVDKFQHETLEAIEGAKLTSAKLAETPWSDDYWAIYLGGAAKRYADATMRYGENWKHNVEQVRNAWKKPLTPAAVDKLSPAEKYDLLVGDDKHGLSEQQLSEGSQYAKPDGSGVETWMGHCHGWSPAAFNVPRPKKAIAVKSADGKHSINFYPADLRALATILWADTDPDTRFIGGRCNTQHPPKDSIGRIKQAECRDVNPATWHLAAVNQIGVAKRSMVLDVTFDYEVWNQPFYSYQYSYFNPKTKKTVPTLAAAKVAKKDFPDDKFKAFRSAQATHIVGIAMDVHWVVETQPTHAKQSGPQDDLTNGARYMYDLELDASGKIIGGEWYQNEHPDFLWTPPAGTHAKASAESATITAAATSWDGKAPLPAALKTSAASASRSGQPLGAIIEKLAAMAHGAGAPATGTTH